MPFFVIYPFCGFSSRWIAGTVLQGLLHEKSMSRTKQAEKRKPRTSHRYPEPATSAESPEACTQRHRSQPHQRHPCPHKLFCSVLLTCYVRGPMA